MITSSETSCGGYYTTSISPPEIGAVTNTGPLGLWYYVNSRSTGDPSPGIAFPATDSGEDERIAIGTCSVKGIIVLYSLHHPEARSCCVQLDKQRVSSRADREWAESTFLAFIVSEGASGKENISSSFWKPTTSEGEILLMGIVQALQLPGNAGTEESGFAPIQQLGTITIHILTIATDGAEVLGRCSFALFIAVSFPSRARSVLSSRAGKIGLGGKHVLLGVLVMSRLEHSQWPVPVEDLTPAISEAVDDFTSSEVGSNDEAVIDVHTGLVIALVPSTPVILLQFLGCRMEGIFHDLCVSIGWHD